MNNSEAFTRGAREMILMSDKDAKKCTINTSQVSTKEEIELILGHVFIYYARFGSFPIGVNDGIIQNLYQRANNQET